MSDRAQSFENHARFVPLYHYVVLPILSANVFWLAWRFIQAPGVDRGIAALTAVALALGVVFGRVFALKAQDRIIRLEMRLRLATVLPADLRGRIADLAPGQLIALRFASDAELPQLVAAVLKDNIQDKKTIKKMVTRWQADHARV